MRNLEAEMKFNKEYVDFKKELGDDSEFSGLYNYQTQALQKGQTNFITANLDDKTIQNKKQQMTFMIDN